MLFYEVAVKVRALFPFGFISPEIRMNKSVFYHRTRVPLYVVHEAKRIVTAYVQSVGDSLSIQPKNL